METDRKGTAVEDVTEGSGSVFADLGLPNADQEQTKARLRHEVARIIEDRGLTQVKAAKGFGHSIAARFGARPRAGFFS